MGGDLHSHISHIEFFTFFLIQLPLMTGQALVRELLSDLHHLPTQTTIPRGKSIAGIAAGTVRAAVQPGTRSAISIVLPISSWRNVVAIGAIGCIILRVGFPFGTTAAVSLAFFRSRFRPIRSNRGITRCGSILFKAVQFRQEVGVVFHHLLSKCLHFLM
jgi:hypothetical protein